MNVSSKYKLWPLMLSLPLGILASVTLWCAFFIPTGYVALLNQYPALKVPFLIDGVEGTVIQFAKACICCALLFVIAGSLGILFRRPWTLRLIRLGYVAWGILFIGYFDLIKRGTRLVLDNKIVMSGITPDPSAVFFWRWHLVWPSGAVFLILMGLYIISCRRRVIEIYGGECDEGPAFGDRVVESLRTHGREPAYRKSLWTSVGIHVMIILVIPWLLTMRGCRVQDYRIQKGSGTATVAAAAAPVKIVKAKKVKRKKYMLNAKSAISFHIPDLDESRVSQEVEKMSQATYVADPSRVLSGGKGGGAGGKMGAGGGKTGGWPDGMDNAIVRFIRLEYNGKQWDDGMDSVNRSDRNFLDEFRRLTGFKVAERGESHPIRKLGSYRKGFAPPFVFMTGTESINIQPSDVKVLRDYLLDGGMLFADCGSPYWDGQFKAFIRVLLPSEPLLEIADDDPIFQAPFTFTNGAPPLWHHGGMRALGVKHKDRWMIFYHPGDVHDAWKAGRSGLSPELASGAMEMGVNIVYYSFTHYLESTKKYRK